MFRAALFVLIAACVVLNVNAASVSNGEFEIHYTTFSSLLIPPEVAATHKITRASNRVVLNIAAVKSEQSFPAQITGHVTNILNQRYELTFDEVRESDAVYYLANHLSRESDILRFDINVIPEGGAMVKLKFLRRYD